MHHIKYLSLMSICKMPKECFDEVFEKCGGVLHTESCGSLPRNKKQITNMRSLANTNVTSNEDERDSLYAIIEQCKQEETGCDPFVRCVQGAPDAMCVLATNLQLQDLVRFCCNPNEYCILGIDPTFSLGEFSVTLTTYRHLQLIGRDTKKPPVMIGPMLIHQRKTSQSYHFLSSSMVGLCPELTSLQAFGTDGEVPLSDAFQLQFKNSTHLVCFYPC